MSAEGAAQLTLALGAFEGPLDLLLDLARRQKVDLSRISIAALVDQYLGFIAQASPRLEIAADYLVMAAWLAYLKSRLLLPAEPEPEPDAAEAALMLRHRLARLEAMREAAAALGARPRLGRDIFLRGAPEGVLTRLRLRPDANLAQLLGAYGAVSARRERRFYRLKARRVMSIEEARRRLAALIGGVPPWTTLAGFLPPGLAPELLRSATASTLVAALEMARSGRARLRQSGPFQPLEIGPA